jgi:hypothetical protein
LAAARTSWSIWAAGGNFGFCSTAIVDAGGTSTRNKPNRFGSNNSVSKVIPMAFPPRPTKARSQTLLHWIATNGEYNWSDRGGGQGCKRDGFATRRRQERYRAAHKLCRQDRQSIVLTPRPAVFNSYILSFNEATLG